MHAGIIEPGHFRFSVVGEKVLRLEERLGYTHKGIEKRFTQLRAARCAIASPGASRAIRRSPTRGPTAWRWKRPPAARSRRARGWLRALLLERERVANHLGDLGALGNDAALAFGLAQFSRLREDWLRVSKEVFGHRLMMDCVVPGGIAGDVDAAAAERIRAQCEATLSRSAGELRSIYDEHAGLQDRFMGTGHVSAELAAELGLTGLAARASGLAHGPALGSSLAALRHAGGDASRRIAAATSRRASPCASTSCSNRCA